MSNLTIKLTMNTTLQKLLTNVPVITDGAWGTHLREYGLKPGECPDAWNIINPQKVESLARRYVDAGSKIILTNTFRSNRLSLRTYDLDDQVIKINRAGVEIARRAAEGNAMVFGSMGHTGKLLSKREIEESKLYQIFSEQAQTLAGTGVDGIVIESMTDLVEAKIALKAAKDTGLPVAVSMIFDSGREKDMTMMGDSPEQAAIELTSAGADIIGANCGLGIEGYIPICRRLRSSTNKPIWIKPSAGLPKVISTKVVFSTTPEIFLQYSKVLCKIGASFIGGCCGTNPEYIRLLSKMVNKK